MPRLLGVELPAKKKIGFSLRYIYGIGPARADLIIATAGLDANMRASDLSEEQLNKILHVITDSHREVPEAFEENNGAMHTMNAQLEKMGLSF